MKNRVMFQKGVLIDSNQQKELLLSMLNSFDTFCKKYAIHYFLAYGTLLGAIRHNDIIPWDDDVDIVVDRTNYNRIVRYCNELDEQLHFASLETDKTYPYPLAKIIDKKTIVEIPFIKKGERFSMGLYIDVFVYDDASPNERDNQHLLKRAQFYQRLWYLAQYNILKKNKYSFFKKIMVVITTPFLRMIGPRKFALKIRKISQKFNGMGSDYFGNFMFVYGNEINNNVIKKEYYGQGVLHLFHGMNLPVPADFDFVLKKQYGDYMKLPPVEERNNNRHSMTVYALSEEE